MHTVLKINCFIHNLKTKGEQRSGYMYRKKFSRMFTLTTYLKVIEIRKLAFISNIYWKRTFFPFVIQPLLWNTVVACIAYFNEIYEKRSMKGNIKLSICLPFHLFGMCWDMIRNNDIQVQLCYREIIML